MEVALQNKLHFIGVDFVNINVTVENHVPKDNPPTIDFKITPKVFYPDGTTDEFVIINDVKLTCKDFFNISIIAFGFFRMPGITGDIKDQKPFININAPAIMFPYIRSFISTLTGNLGVNFQPIIIPPHFFHGELEEHIETPKIQTGESTQIGSGK